MQEAQGERMILVQHDPQASPGVSREANQAGDVAHIPHQAQGTIVRPLPVGLGQFPSHPGQEVVRQPPKSTSISWAAKLFLFRFITPKPCLLPLKLVSTPPPRRS